jgi:hypothetical protein
MNAWCSPAKRAVLGLAIASTAALAQDVAILRKHTTEVGGFVGASYGVDKSRIMGGGNITYSLFTNLLPYAEVSYFPGIGRESAVSGITGAKAVFSLPATDFNFGVHLRVRLPNTRIVPYAVLGAGGMHLSGGTEIIESRNPLDPTRIDRTSVPRAPETSYATNFGGGFRLYAKEHLGFRGEFKAYKLSNDAFPVFYRVTGGFFFQF